MTLRKQQKMLGLIKKGLSIRGCDFVISGSIKNVLLESESTLQGQQMFSLADLSKTPLFLRKLDYFEFSKKRKKRSGRLSRNRESIANNLKAQISLLLSSTFKQNSLNKMIALHIISRES